LQTQPGGISLENAKETDILPAGAGHNVHMKAKLLMMTGLWLAGVSMSLAQTGAGSPAGIGAAFTKLFGDITAFSAKADLRVLDKTQQEIMRGPMTFALQDNKVRVELEMTEFKNKNEPPGSSAEFKRMGLSHVVSIIRPDKKLIYVIYPDRKAVTSMPLPKEEAEAAEKKPKLQKTEIGKETIEGHACVKNKVVVSGDKGPILEATTWNATDLKDFPIQIQTGDQNNTSIVTYRQVQLSRPDDAQFDSPPGYKQYNDAAELMEEIQKKGATK
jgi:hypothetical protein